VQVIGAHAADFVARGRCGRQGGVARRRGRGDRALYGERGESGELWKQEGQTVENVKRIRHAEAEAAAGHLGASFRCLDLGDYPLQIDGDALLAIADAIREFAPDVLITHTDTDPFNLDHPVAFAAVPRAAWPAGAGVSSAFPTISPPQLFLLRAASAGAVQLHADGARRHHRGVRKVAAMAEMKAQQPADLLRAARRAARQSRAARVGRRGRALRRVLPACATGGRSAVNEEPAARRRDGL
jgi:4-oxalomesaconate hydratase